MESFFRDLRHGARQLARTPGFTLAAVATLALGIGANSAIFSLVNAMLLRPAPVEEPDRLARVFSKKAADGVSEAPLAWPDYVDFRDRSGAFEELAVYAANPMALEIGGENELIVGELVSENYFETLGISAQRGRFFDAAGGTAPGSQPVAVLNHSTWERRFGSDPAVIGRDVRLNGTPVTIVGVAPRGFNGLLRGLAPEVWVPMGLHASIRPGPMGRLEERRPRWLFCVGRLADGVSVEQARERVAGLADALAAEYPDTNEGRGATVLALDAVAIIPMVDRVLTAVSVVLMGIVGLVLLIACGNVANMLLARAAARRRELAVRLSLGAPRGRIARQLLTESGLLALLGGTAALLVVAASNAALGAVQLPLPLRIDVGLSLDARVLGFTFLAALATTLMFGLAPALQAGRTDLTEALKADARGGSPVRRGLRQSLVVGQLALSTVLLAGAGLSLRSLGNAHRIDPGLEADGVVTAQLHPGLRGYDAAGAEAYFDELLERVQALPGVERAAWASHLPLGFEIWEERVAAEETADPDRDRWPSADAAQVGPGYFEVVGVPILQGRAFDGRDVEGAPRVAVVNQTLASRYWPRESPLGKRLLVDRDEEPWTVVGVARDGRYRTLGEAPRPFVWRPLGQTPGGTAPGSTRTLVARMPGASGPALAAIRSEARALDEKVPLTDLETLEQALSASLILPRGSAVVLGTFGVLGLLLAAFGTWGLIGYTTSLRSREMGVRIALGARGADVTRLVIGQGLRLTAVGLAVGCGLALVLGRALQAVLYGVGPADPLTYAGVAGVLGAAALLAALGPARRAARVDPMTVLRSE